MLEQAASAPATQLRPYGNRSAARSVRTISPRTLANAAFAAAALPSFMHLVPYFAYGTTQKGFAHHRRFADLLGVPAGRFRTVSAHAVVVPRRAACGNPGCPYNHRMAALVPGIEPLRVEGDLFFISDATVGVIDQLETGSAGLAGPYVRRFVNVVSLDGATTHTAHAYVAREPARWRALVDFGQADALTTYPYSLAAGERLKDCCVRTPGHPPPHDVVDRSEARHHADRRAAASRAKEEHRRSVPTCSLGTSRDSPARGKPHSRIPVRERV